MWEPRLAPHASCGGEPRGLCSPGRPQGLTLHTPSSVSRAESPGLTTVSTDRLLGRQNQDGVKYSWTHMSQSGFCWWALGNTISFSICNRESHPGSHRGDSDSDPRAQGPPSPEKGPVQTRRPGGSTEKRALLGGGGSSHLAQDTPGGQAGKRLGDLEGT